ncbi:MAG: SDR family NAD(P)-dependent oxidoreductase [Gemmatimonadota bacterium]
MLVTGGSRGIGRATAVLLAAAGARVGIAYHRAHDEAERAVREAGEAARRARAGRPGAGEAEDRAGARIWAEPGDVSRPDEVQRLFARVDEEFRELEGFVGNAGVWNAAELPLEELEPEAWRRMLDVNLTSLYLTTRAAVRRMKEGARIVLLSSTAGQRGEAGHSHYAASKGAIIAFCKSLAAELGPRGITVNAVAPGWVDTEMSASVLRTPARDAVIGEIPLRRVATAADVAGPICFLLSDLARHVTGEVLNVNGGSVLCG